MSARVSVAPDVVLHARLGRAGSATPLLFVHGFASMARLRVGVAAVVAATGHGSVAVGRRGHGRSSQVTDGFDFATLATDVDAVFAATIDCASIIR